MLKILTLILTALMLFTSNTHAKTAEEKAAAKEQKQMRKLAKAYKIENAAIILQWAEEGDVQAQCILAYAYSTGQRFKKDKYMALKWHNKALEKNRSLANNFIPIDYRDSKLDLSKLFGLAAYYSHDGKYVEQSFADSVRWGSLGTKELDFQSMAYIGSAYYTGRGLPQNYEKAIKYLRLADEDPLALELLSDAYAKGNGVEANENKSKFFADYLKLVQNPKIHQDELIIFRKIRKSMESR